MSLFLRKKIVIFASLILMIVIFPLMADAAAPLVPCGRGSDVADRCTLCHLIVGVHGIVGYIRNLLAGVAIAMIAVGGVMYVISAGSQQMMEKAKSVIQQALIGVAIVLGAWLIINTMMLFLGASDNLGVNAVNWYTFDCK
ncbi:MAG: pilin [Candidatus Moranbacteria bacterium]|nr:pilin [Candidatus Moranbacteria bacterium]